MKCDVLPALMKSQPQVELQPFLSSHLETCSTCTQAWARELAIHERLRKFKSDSEMSKSLPQKVRELLSPESPAISVAMLPPARTPNLFVVKDDEIEARADTGVKDVPGNEIEATSIMDELLHELLHEHILEVTAALSPRERDVLRLRFGLDDGCQRTREEVAEMFGITRERVRLIEARALRSLRQPDRVRRSRPHLE